MISRNRMVWTGILLFLSIGSLNAQDSPKPSFEVASIKPAESCVQKFSTGNSTIAMMTPPIMSGGRFSVCNSLQGLVMQAYQIEDDSQLSGLPAWGKNSLFQIEAKSDPAANADQMRGMLQTLLEERFNLKVHHESREMETYSLVIAKSGHKLQPAKDENGNPVTAIPPQEQNLEKIREAIAQLQSGKKMKSAPGSIRLFLGGNGPVQFEGSAMQIRQLVLHLRQTVGRKVFDKTGLAGFYDIKMQYAAEPGKGSILIMAQPNPVAGDSAKIPEPELSGPTIFNALRDQLGLELQPDKGSLEFFTVDSVEKPSEN